MEFLKSDIFVYILLGVNIVFLLLYIMNQIKLSKIRKEYLQFIKKLGNGNNIEEMLRSYISKVEEVSEKNKELYEYCHHLDNDITRCIQKIGMVRYNAFSDTGSDLSFTLALLDEQNNGVVLNGIYSREMSNIYAKPIIKGNSTYTLSEEERQAIDKAIYSQNIYKMKE